MFGCYNIIITVVVVKKNIATSRLHPHFVKKNIENFGVKIFKTDEMRQKKT